MTFENLVPVLRFSPYSFSLSSEIKFPLDLLKSYYDMNDCLSNCTNHGLCKLVGDRFKCFCNSNYAGPECNQVSSVSCISNPCINHIKCEDLNNQTDFKCYCKSELYYGKRCEWKRNLCANETCSGNGVCKIINEYTRNETTKCECFGIDAFEGEKCQIKTINMIVRETKIKGTYYVAIIALILLYSLFISSDLHTFFIFKLSKKNRDRLNLKLPFKLTSN